MSRLKIIDLRSDTVTLPTNEMRQAMLKAEVGDDVYKEDAEMNELEEMAAAIMGKEAALFVPSGTMGNQLAIMTHTKRGDEIIAGAKSHVVRSEVGAAAVISNVSICTIANPDNTIYPEDIRNSLRNADDIHQPVTSLLCLENALSSGDVVPLNVLQEDYKTAKSLGLNVHMDGARIFNAAVSLGVDVKEIAACTDSVMFCLSKGLCAPVGSMLCGTKKFINRALRNRKLLGGGMRQVGFLAACGKIALNKMTERLHEDHDNARILAEGLADIPGVEIDLSKVKINMVFCKINREENILNGLVGFLQDNGVKTNGFDRQKTIRLVTHYGIEKEDINYVLDLIKKYLDT